MSTAMPPITANSHTPQVTKVWQTSLGRISLALMTLGLVLIIASCAATSEPAGYAKGTTTFTLEVEGTAPTVDISYNAPGGENTTEKNAILPWSKEVTLNNSDIAQVDAEGDPSMGGEVTCRIRYGEDVIVENTSTPEFPLTACTKMVSDLTN